MSLNIKKPKLFNAQNLYNILSKLSEEEREQTLVGFTRDSFRGYFTMTIDYADIGFIDKTRYIEMGCYEN